MSPVDPDDETYPDGASVGQSAARVQLAGLLSGAKGAAPDAKPVVPSG